jgi:hypothetical protein
VALHPLDGVEARPQRRFLDMPALFLVLGLAAVVAIAAASGHAKKAGPATQKASPPTGTVELDHGMPDAVVRQVLSALSHDTSGAHLEELAHQLEARYPLSARELRAKAATIHAATTAQTMSTVGHAAAPELPAASHSTTPMLASRSTDNHELQAANVLQAAMRALVEEPDPVVLDGFAESIRTLYPTAATLLLARAHALRTASAPAHAALSTAATDPNGELAPHENAPAHAAMEKHS